MKLVGVAVVVGSIACSQPPIPRGSKTLLRSWGNEPQLKVLFQDTVTNGGLWFADPMCARDFQITGEVPFDAYDEFAHCLSKLDLRATARSGGLLDLVVMEYGPGIEIHVRIGSSHLSWIGFEAAPKSDPVVPTITSAALDSIRISRGAVGALQPRSFAWIRLCLAPNGTVLSAHSFESSDLTVGPVFEAAARASTFKPFMLGGRPSAVCSMVRMSNDTFTGTEVVPFPPPETKSGVEPIVIDGDRANALFISHRVSGSEHVAPTLGIQRKMESDRVRVLRSAYRVCVDESGNVESLFALTASYPAYDRQVAAAVRAWKFSPFVIDDHPVPVCSYVDFRYEPPK